LLVPTGQSSNEQKDILGIIQRSPGSCARARGPCLGVVVNSFCVGAQRVAPFLLFMIFGS